MIFFKKLHKDAIIPKAQREGDGGLDITTLESKTIWPGEQESFRTGISCAIPGSWVGQIRPRSGLALKHQIDTKAGVIDSNYRGEIVVVLRNDGIKEYQFERGDRIAQLIVTPCLVNSKEVDELDDTDRGGSGFGSSGK
jgi:dUTP pyrophosphatase